ncbi:MAG: zeta toxin family protein [Flavisolibacter sp.]
MRQYRVNGRTVDFGLYINADEIASELLKKQPYHFSKLEIQTTNAEFKQIALASGLVNPEFPEKEFFSSYTLRTNYIRLKNEKHVDRLAQIIADFLRKKLLGLKKRFSFETVFSHESKLDIMKRARDAGYKVYLYFVSTESPEINKFRVKARVAQKGHDVPPEKIESRYYRSMDLLHQACQLAYQVFFFDNSKEVTDTTAADELLFAHFTVQKNTKNWDESDSPFPAWFYRYYLDKE